MRIMARSITLVPIIAVTLILSLPERIYSAEGSGAPSSRNTMMGKDAVSSCESNIASLQTEDASHPLPPTQEPVLRWEPEAYSAQTSAPLHIETTGSEFRLLIIPVYFAEDPDCDPDCPVGNYECDNFQPVAWRPSYANIWNTYFCMCDEEPCDECVEYTCSEPPCPLQYPSASTLSIGEYYRDNFYGNLMLTGDVTPNYQLVVDVCPGQSGVLNDIAEAAVAAAQSDHSTGPAPGVGWDIALDTEGKIVSDTYDGMVILHPRVPYSNFYGFTVRSRRIIWQDGLDWRVGTHELGHLMADGIGHSGSWECLDTVWDGECDRGERNDYYDIMGYGYGHFTVPHKRRYGFLAEDQVYTLSPGERGIFTLTPLETLDGLKTLRMPRDDEFYHFEFRQPIDDVERNMSQTLIDNFDGLDMWDLNGLIAYRTLGGANGSTLLLDLTPNSIVGENHTAVVADHIDGLLREGQTFYDSQSGLITVLALRNPGTKQAEIDVEVEAIGDCNSNSFIDVCELDCMALGGRCNGLGCGEGSDCDGNNILDECQDEYADCNHNGVMDACDITEEMSTDVLPPAGDGVPDECQSDCNGNSLPDTTEPGGTSDCDFNGIVDFCQILQGEYDDCNDNFIPDTCEPGGLRDCNENSVSDWCEIAALSAEDCNENWLIDSCEVSTLWEKTKLVAIDGEANQQMGASVDLTEEWLVAGAPRDSSAVYRAGSVSVFHFESSEWVPHSKLVAPDPSFNDYFGQSLAIDGSTLAIAAYADDDDGTDSGSVHVYEFDGAQWTWQTKLTAGDAAAHHQFGWSVDVEGTTIVVGAPEEDSSGVRSGAVYVFELQDNQWLQTQKLVAEDTKADAAFGSDVSLSADRLLIGAQRDDGHGSVYVFELSGGHWAQSAKLNANTPIDGDYFGTSVSIDGDALVVGTYNPLSLHSGKAYIFSYHGTQWSQKVILQADDSQSRNQFGRAVDIDQGRVVVGAPQVASAYVFDYDSALWRQTSKLQPFGGSGGNLGQSVVVKDDWVIAGRPTDPSAGQEAGSVNAYRRMSPDCNTNGFLDSCEVGSVPGADVDANGILDACLPEEDCNWNSIPDVCDFDCSAPFCRVHYATYCGRGVDHNGNQILDECESNQTWYVDDDAPSDPAPGDPSISDAVEDGSVEHPYDTLQEAIDRSISGDTILVSDGIYYSPSDAVIDVGSRLISIRSLNGPAHCVIDGRGAAPGIEFTDGDSTNALFLASLEGFTITGMHRPGGGSITCYRSDPHIRNCIIAGNHGGIYSNEAAPLIRNCLIHSNQSEEGTNVRITGVGASAPSLVNTTLLDTRVYESGEISITNLSISDPAVSQPATINVKNCLIWRTQEAEAGSIYLTGNSVNIEYSNIQGGQDGIVRVAGYLNYQMTNIQSDPQWIDADGGDNDPSSWSDNDYHLMEDSPCRNAGDPTTSIVYGEVDIDGQPRILDDRIDIGADEVFLDCNGNGILDSEDLSMGESTDCDSNGRPDECDPYEDCNSNGFSDVCDIAAGTSLDANHNDIPDECEANRTIYVDDDAPHDPGPGEPTVSDPNADGSTEHPYDDIREAVVKSVSGDTIIVRDGTYTGNNHIALGSRSLIIRSENGPSNCIIDGQGNAHGYVFHLSDSEETSLIEGFTIRNFNSLENGAILCEEARVVISQCVMSNLGIGGDGAIAGWHSDVTVRDCSLDTLEGSGVYGAYSSISLKRCQIQRAADAGILLLGSNVTMDECVLAHNSGVSMMGSDSRASVSNTQFTRNQCTNHLTNHGYGAALSWYDGDIALYGVEISHNTGAAHGGGMYLENCGNVLLSDSLITNNTASHLGGGINAAGSVLHLKHTHLSNNTANIGGGIRMNRTSMLFENSTMSGNAAVAYAAGVYSHDGDITLMNSVIANNRAPLSSGIMLSGGKAHLANTTLTGNHTESIGGILASDGAKLSVANTVMWHNDTPQGMTFLILSGTELEVDYSNIQNGPAGIMDWSGDNSVWWDAETTLDIDPLFQDAPAGNFRLDPSSPCIDAGNNSRVPARFKTDLDELLRIVDGNGFSEAGTYDTVDLGAYEYQPDPCSYADLNHDGHVNADDLQRMQDCVTVSDHFNVECRAADLDHNGSINEDDESVFVDLYTKCFEEAIGRPKERSPSHAAPLDNAVN